MPASYVDKTYVENVIGASVVEDLFSDDDVSDTKLTQIIEMASDMVRSFVVSAGYALGETTTSATVKSATVGVFITLAYGRRHKETPPTLALLVELASRVASGDVEFHDVDPLPADSVGGSSFTEQSTTNYSSEDGIARRVFSLSRLRVL